MYSKNKQENVHGKSKITANDDFLVKKGMKWFNLLRFCVMQVIKKEKKKKECTVDLETSVNHVLFELTCCVEVAGQIAKMPRPTDREAGGRLHEGLTSDDAVFPQYVLT